MQGGGWGLMTVWAVGGRQSHGGGVVVASHACSGLRLLSWFIVGNDGADVGGYLSVPLPGLWWCGFLVRCGCVVWWCGASAHLVWLLSLYDMAVLLPFISKKCIWSSKAAARASATDSAISTEESCLAAL
jgi:hypothetical protein